MKLRKRYSPLSKPVLETHVVPDPEQLPFDIDHIICPKCKKVQGAKILYGWAEFYKVHSCIDCGYIIREGEWKSIQ